jgi:hypothetical protein
VNFLAMTAIIIYSREAAWEKLEDRIANSRPKINSKLPLDREIHPKCTESRRAPRKRLEELIK